MPAQLVFEKFFKIFLYFSQTWKSSRSDKFEWTEDEKKRKKKTFTLDIDKHKDVETISSPRDKQKTILKQPRKPEDATSHASKEFLKTGEKPKRAKVRTRSPLQGHRKNQQGKKISPSLMRSPAVTEQYSQELWVKPGTSEAKPPLTSDESSSGVCGDQTISGQVSPRKNKKFKENNRRKSIPRSPTGSRVRRRSESIEEKPSSLPGSLPRRRSMQANLAESQSKSRLSPYRYLAVLFFILYCLFLF